MQSSDWRGVAAEIRRSATRRGRLASGCCVIEGTRLHRRALRAGVRIESVLQAEGSSLDTAERTRQLGRELRASARRMHVVPDEVVAELTEGRASDGLIGLVGLPDPAPVEQLLGRRSASPPVALVGCDIEDPGNVGALARTALAAGAAALICVGLTDPWHPKAVRTSMGSSFKLPLPAVPSPAALLRVLAEIGARSLGAVSSGGTALHDIRVDRRPIAVFLGSESSGLPSELQAAMDERVTVPMATAVDSFSINAAAAVMLYEIRRPRH